MDCWEMAREGKEGNGKAFGTLRRAVDVLYFVF
jgi:hypothetical protein